MKDLLAFMGEHPILTFFLGYCVCETIRQIGIAFCKIFWPKKPEKSDEKKRIYIA